MGMALCLLDRSTARTLSHWHQCSRWHPAPADEVQRRLRWLQRKRVDVGAAAPQPNQQQAINANQQRVQ